MPERNPLLQVAATLSLGVTNKNNERFCRHIKGIVTTNVIIMLLLLLCYYVIILLC